MRPVLRLLGTRYGIALVLTLLVLGAVGIARSVTGTYQNAPLAGPATEPSLSSSNSAGPTAGNDSVPTPESPSPPLTSPGAAPPEQVAADFTRAWLKHDGVTSAQWRQSLAKYATPALLEKLKDTDPAGVPAKRTTGPVTLQNRAATFVEAILPVDSGTLRLRLLATNGRWLVDGVDWERA
jgi:hypothetical protein